MDTDLGYTINKIPVAVSLQNIQPYQLWGESPRQKGGLVA